MEVTEVLVEVELVSATLVTDRVTAEMAEAEMVGVEVLPELPPLQVLLIPEAEAEAVAEIRLAQTELAAERVLS